jgi:hypothetical protein
MADQFRLRLSLTDGPSLRCPYCGEWWPITTDFWRINVWYMCLACLREKAKLYQLLRGRDAQYRAKKAEKSRRYRKWLAETCPQYLPAYDRERKARDRERARLHRAKQKGERIEKLEGSTLETRERSIA